MQIFQTIARYGHEEVVFFNFPPAGLKAIIAIHNTTLGPALGGLRMWPYASDEDALDDVLRMSEGMTYTAAVSGLNLGGGKAVLIGDPEADKSEALFRALGRFIDSLGGRFVVTEDVGTDADDMEFIGQETRQVVGVHPVHGGCGDPSPFTAMGTLHGIRASLQRRFGHEDLGKLSYAVQGVGSVGAELVRMLSEAGAQIFVADINEERVHHMVEEYGATAVGMDEIYDVDCTVFAPCAYGGVINEQTVPRLRCQIVAGGANNQLESEHWGTELERRGILYAPDFAVSGGGVINAATELAGYDRLRATHAVSRIYTNTLEIFRIAERDGVPSWAAAKQFAQHRIDAMGSTSTPYLARA